MTMGQNQTTDARGGKFAEVFTPANIVFFMILQPDLRDVITDEHKIWLDPAAGQGQFGCSELVLRMFYTALDKPPEERVKCVLINLANIYSLELQAKNVDQCRRHFFDTVCDAYEFFFGEEFQPFMTAAKIILDRVIQCNSLEWISEHTPPENRTKEYYDRVKEMAKSGHISQECADRILNVNKNAQTALF